jgi:S-adenosylmethionine decarboxylase
MREGVGIATGHAWVVDALRCDEGRLRSTEALGAVFEALVRELDLKPLGPPTWHRFPGPGGVTGFLLLSESHVAVHTFPEVGFAAFDLYCCRERADWPWAERLLEHLGAEAVRVRRLARGDDALGGDLARGEGAG